MMKGILEKSNFNGLTRKKADYAMVEAEQTPLSSFMETYVSKIGGEKFNEMMDNLNNALNHPLIQLNYIKNAKKVIGSDIDFRNQSHREALGKALVDEKHE